jgi:hypothetical protein
MQSKSPRSEPRDASWGLGRLWRTIPLEDYPQLTSRFAVEDRIA